MAEVESERVLYWEPGSVPSWRVLAALTEKGLKYESRAVEFVSGGHKSPEVLAINPRGQVPAFKDGDIVVNESFAVLQYLEKQYPEPALCPRDAAGYAMVTQRLWEVATLSSLVLKHGLRRLFKGDVTEDERKAVVDSTLKELSLWEKYTKDGYVAGSHFTLADLAAGPVFLMLKRAGATFHNLPNLQAYTETVAARESIAAHTPPYWKDTEGINVLSAV